MNWVIGILIVIVVWFFISKKSMSWQNLYDTGIRHYRAENYLEAIKYLLKALDKNPENPEIWCLYGDSCLKQSVKLDYLGVEEYGFKKIAVSSFINSLKLSPYIYNSNQMIDSICALILKGGDSTREEGHQFAGEIKKMLNELPNELKKRIEKNFHKIKLLKSKEELKSLSDDGA